MRTDNLISHFSSFLIFILLAQAGGKAVPPTPTSPADWEVCDNNHHAFYLLHLKYLLVAFLRLLPLVWKYTIFISLFF